MAGAACASAAANSSGIDYIDDEFICTDEDLLYEFVDNCREYSTPVVLKKLSELLSKAAILVGDGKSMDVVPVCKALPHAIRRCLDEQVVEDFHPTEEEFDAQVFEVLSRLVDFTVAFLSDFVGRTSKQRLLLPCLKEVLEAIHVTFDSKMRFYGLSRENSKKEIHVLPSRLECALQVPGYFVKVFGDTDGQTHCFCSQKGVNQVGAACECCTRPSEADAILLNVFWQLAKTARGSGYECLLKILSTYKEAPLKLMNLLLRPFVLVLECCIYDNSWRVVLEHMESNFSEVGGMMRICHSAYHNVFQNLTNALNLHFWGVYYGRKSFIEILIHLHTISSWSVPYSRAHPCADGAVLSFENADQLLLMFLERTMASGKTDLICTIVGEFINARLTHAPGHDLPFIKTILQWLKEKKPEDWIVRNLLLDDATKFICEEMIKFVELVGKEGLVLHQKDFLALINRDLGVESGSQQTLDKRYAQARIMVAILVNFNLDPYIPEFMNGVCDWLERWQAVDSVFTSHMVCYIVEKLIDCDKDRKWENRLLSLLWNQACKLPARESAGYLRRIAWHYTFMTEPNIVIHPGEETENFLQACSSADRESSVSRSMGIKFEERAVCEQRAKIYQDMEVDFNFRTSLQLRHILNTDFPLTSHETSKECLKRLGQAQHLISGLKTTPHINMETVTTLAVAPELRALEAIKKEIALRSELRQSMQEANGRHLREYDALKQDHYKALEKFFEECLKEKKEMVKDALYAKAKVIAVVEMANLNPNTELSSDDILTTILQTAEYTLEEVKANHKKSLEKVPNSECNVCFMDFSLKRKRACFDPCGHTGTCIDCGLQEWKRTKTCPLCQCDALMPTSVPSMLFFG